MWRLWPVIVAGEAIFVLPFIIPRLFRPAMIQQWGVSNTQIGAAMSLYGFVAVAAYFAGGPLADRFAPRTLMTTALLATAACGTLLVGTPTTAELSIAYAGFGLTTILLFWSAMIRATHRFGGGHQPGFAFGLLDGGRGLFAAALASTIVVLVDENASMDTIIQVGIFAVVLVAAAVWMSLSPHPNTSIPAEKISRPQFSLSQVSRVLGNRGVWLQGSVLLCAYIGYKSVDNFGIYAVDRYGYTAKQAAMLTSVAFWLRPPAAVLAGLVADRLSPFVVMTALFAAMAAASGLLCLGAGGGFPVAMIVASIAVAAASVYAMRAVYFSVMDKLSVPETGVGTAAGLISTVGFLPDIFFAALTGYWIDHYRGTAGYRITFSFVALTAILGATISLWQLHSIDARRRFSQDTN